MASFFFFFFFKGTPWVYNVYVVPEGHVRTANKVLGQVLNRKIQNKINHISESLRMVGALNPGYKNVQTPFLSPISPSSPPPFFPIAPSFSPPCTLYPFYFKAAPPLPPTHPFLNTTRLNGFTVKLRQQYICTSGPTYSRKLTAISTFTAEFASALQFNFSVRYRLIGEIILIKWYHRNSCTWVVNLIYLRHF